MAVPFLTRAADAERVKVKRDGPRGWHWISAASFDPRIHVPFDPPQAEQPAAEVKRGPGRPRKQAPQEA